MQNDANILFFSTLSRMQRLYTKSLHTRLGPYDVKPGYLDILHSLWAQDEITQKQLNASLDIEQATLSNTLARMQRDGLIARKADTRDRRHKYIYLTEKGKSLQPAVLSAIEDLQKLVNTGLTVNDRRYFNRVLKQMTEQLEEDQAEPLLMLLDEVVETTESHCQSET